MVLVKPHPHRATGQQYRLAVTQSIRAQDQQAETRGISTVQQASQADDARFRGPEEHAVDRPHVNLHFANPRLIKGSKLYN